MNCTEVPYYRCFGIVGAPNIKEYKKVIKKK